MLKNQRDETYKKANKRRSESFRKRAEARKIIEDSRYERNLKLQTGVGKKLANEDSSVEEFSSVPNDETQASSLTFFPDKSDMRELQLSRLKRSRRAAKAYQTRRENIAKNSPSRCVIVELPTLLWKTPARKSHRLSLGGKDHSETTRRHWLFSY